MPGRTKTYKNQRDMKAEHRHELKTNILAEWLGNFPQWARENTLPIIGVLILAGAVGAFYFWRAHNKNARIQEQLRLTNLVNQITNGKMQVLNNRGAGGSTLLFRAAQDLEAFAESTGDDNLAAMAFLKHAEALRTELHYRSDPPTNEDLIRQISLARQSYAKAIEKAVNNPSLAGAAKLGLGLCAEELGNFDKAKEIYREIVNDPVFQGTVSVAQAKLRLETIEDYKKNIVFKPRPRPPKPPTIEPADANKPADADAAAAGAEATDANAPARTTPGPDADPQEAQSSGGTKPAELKTAPRIPDVPPSAPPAGAKTKDPNGVRATTEANAPSL